MGTNIRTRTNDSRSVQVFSILGVSCRKIHTRPNRRQFNVVFRAERNRTVKMRSIYASASTLLVSITLISQDDHGEATQRLPRKVHLKACDAAH